VSSKLIEALKRWRGRPFVMQELQRRGFHAPARYEGLVAKHCDAEAARDLGLYWDEIAREYICSRGTAQWWVREFPRESGYRSSYLDKLAAHRPVSPHFQRAHMHPCILAFETKRKLQPGFFVAEITEPLEKLKREEIAAHAIRESDWSGIKRDVRPIFQARMAEKGFKKRGRLSVKETSSGLTFVGGADLGRQVYSAITFNLSIVHNEAMPNDDAFSLQFRNPAEFNLRFRNIAEGFYIYQLGRDTGSVLLGMQAHVEMIDILFQSFASDF
jgi:hypothetical protein